MSTHVLLRGRSLHFRVFFVNAVLVIAAGATLLLSPATVSRTPTDAEVAVVLAGVVALLTVNWTLVRRALRPLQVLGRQMQDVDLLHSEPRLRLPALAEPELRMLVAAYETMLARLRAERRDSARRALSAQEAERRRVARELHDGVGQSLTGLLLLVDQAAEAPRSQQPALLEEVRAGARSSLDDVRRIARRLRPEVLDDLGLSSALTALCTAFARQSGLAVDRDIETDLPPLTADAELATYRIAQESLTNVARHAGATTVAVRLRRTGAGVRLEVRDDGVGFDGGLPASAAGGLRGMDERAVLIDAALEIRSAAGGGAVVSLDLPAT